MSNGKDIPVMIPRVTGKGPAEVLEIIANGKPLGTAETGGKKLRITVKSGKNVFSVPVDKENWNLTIEVEDNETTNATEAP